METDGETLKTTSVVSSQSSFDLDVIDGHIHRDRHLAAISTHYIPSKIRSTATKLVFACPSLPYCIHHQACLCHHDVLVTTPTRNK